VSRSTTLILLAIALGLGAYVWFGEIQGKRSQAEAEKQKKLLVEAPRANWTGLVLRTSDGQQAQLVRAEGDRWQLAAPVSYAVDEATVDRALDALAELAFESEIQPPPADLKPFGLDDASKRVELRSGEGEPLVIQLGGHTPVGSARYLMLSNRPGRIYTVRYSATTALEPSLLDLRDKRIAELDPAKVQRLVVRTGGQSIELARAAEGWQLTAPLADRADSERVDRLLEDVQLARASGFVDAPGPLSDYGLEPPEVELEIAREAGPLQLRLGRAGDKYYARAGEGGPVFEVRERLVSGVPRRVFEYRYKRVLTLDESKVQQIVLAFPRESTTQQLRREQNKWVSQDAGFKLDSLKVSDLLYALEALDATGAEDGQLDKARLGFEPPSVRVSALDESGKELGWLELGNPDPERGLAARASEAPERIWRVDSTLGEDVPLSAEAYRSAFAEKPEPPSEPPAADSEPAPAAGDPISDEP
jgi:hypothetical protein